MCDSAHLFSLQCDFAWLTVQAMKANRPIRQSPTHGKLSGCFLPTLLGTDTFQQRTVLLWMILRPRQSSIITLIMTQA